MSEHIPDDASPAGRDLRAYADELRRHHPVVRNLQGEWVLLTRDLVVQAAQDPLRFSSGVSRFLQVPNGLDGADHAAFRAVLDRFMTGEALAPFQPAFEQVATGLAASLPRDRTVEAVHGIGARFAVRAQSAWLGWPAELEDSLMDWVAENHAATRSGDSTRTAQVASRFDAIIASLLAERRDRPGTASADITTRLMDTRVSGRLLTEPEVVSVLRNWTGGDLGSIALCVGVVVHFLATHADAQDRLRGGVPDAELDATIDEILRIDDPFVSNRRVTTCPVELGGASLPSGARVKLNWTSANRDEAVFDDPDRFDPAANAAGNLVYGTGPHACPGRLLATIELRTAVRALLAATASIRLDPSEPPEREVAPVGGWARVPVRLS